MKITELLTDKEKERCIIRKISKGDTLFHENDSCNEIGIVLKGKIEIVSYLNDGSELIFNTISEGGLFGNNLIFSSEPYYKGNVIALSDAEIMLIKKELLIELLENNSAFLIEYLHILSDTGKQLNSRIRLLSIASAEERFFCYLHDHKNRITYTSVSQLARELYLSREAVSRLLYRLVKEKKIIKSDKTIRLL
ncbi:MAG: Crp/Fnr family transcriptional regulator [Erysipelotrichaceae bacterium]|nr:Crp/Fnr family transcriptional regulator [Erysipelotrichaceae bacterium]